MRRYICCLLAFLSSACGSFLDEVDQDKLIPENAEHYAAVLLKEFNYKFPVDATVDFMTDNILENARIPESRRASYRTMYIWKAEIELDENNEGVAVNKAWRACYEDIAIANYVLELIDEGGGSEQEKQFVKGEAYFVRGYCYFNLVNLYGQPFKPESAGKDPGVPLRKGTAVEQVYTRASVKACYEQIVEDLLEAKRLIVSSGITKSKWHPDELACDLLLSRVYLYIHEWQLAADCASNVIAKRSLSRVTANAPLISEEKDEVIYTACQMPFFDRVTFEKGWQVSPELLASYLPGDARRESFFSEASALGVSISMKQEHSFTEMGTYNFRVSEAYLNRAEAYVMLGSESLAADDMRTLLSYRFMNASQYEVPESNLLSFVLQERRKELCFEEHHRWFDLRRMNVRPTIEHTYTRTDAGGGYNGKETYRLTPNDLNYTLPIPLEEREKNPLIKNNERRDKVPE